MIEKIFDKKWKFISDVISTTIKGSREPERDSFGKFVCFWFHFLSYDSFTKKNCEKLAKIFGPSKLVEGSENALNRYFKGYHF